MELKLVMKQMFCSLQPVRTALGLLEEAQHLSGQCMGKRPAAEAELSLYAIAASTSPAMSTAYAAASLELGAHYVLYS